MNYYRENLSRAVFTNLVARVYNDGLTRIIHEHLSQVQSEYAKFTLLALSSFASVVGECTEFRELR
jgi:hypothetical protein